MSDPKSDPNPEETTDSGDSQTPGQDEPLLDPHGFPIGRQHAPKGPEDGSTPYAPSSGAVEGGAASTFYHPKHPDTEERSIDPDVAGAMDDAGAPQPNTAPETKTRETLHAPDGAKEILEQNENFIDPADIETLSQTQSEDSRVAALEQELAQMKDQALRAIAEQENTRRRSQKEREDASRYSISNFARDMLEIADNLRRGLEAIPDDLKAADQRLENVVEGIEATERSLLNAFDRHGIVKLEPMDEIFDPNFHEVMFEAPGTGKPAGTIIQLIEVGYMLKDRLLRPARVGVAKDEGQGSGAPEQGTPGGQIDQEV